MFLADCAREIRSVKQREVEEMVKRIGISESNLNLNSGYSTIGLGAIRKPLSEMYGGPEKE